MAKKKRANMQPHIMVAPKPMRPSKPAKQVSKQTNKSRRLATDLRDGMEEKVRIDNPFAKLMEDAAKHIEWLELIVTGISHKDRNTIAKLARRKKLDDEMIARRDAKIEELKREISDLKRDHKDEVRGIAEEHAEEYEWLKRKKFNEFDDKMREAIEREFIEQLLTSKQTKKLKSSKKQLKEMLGYRRDEERRYF